MKSLSSSTYGCTNHTLRFTPFRNIAGVFSDLEEKDNIFASVLSHADDRVGELLDAIDRLAISENTLVIFSSDNGPARAREGQELLL